MSSPTRMPPQLPYRLNSMDCARVTEAAWRQGKMQQAAGRAPFEQPNGYTVAIGEPAWHHEEWTGNQLSMSTGEEILAALAKAGHGSSAVVITEWYTSTPEHLERRAAHAYNLQNYQGQVIVVDGQLGEGGEPHPISIHPLLANKPIARHLWIAWDRKGRVVSPNTTPAVRRFTR